MKSLDKSLTKETIKIYWKFTKQEKWMASLAVLMVVVNALFQAYLPYLYKRLLDVIAFGSVTPEAVARGLQTILFIRLVV